MRLVLCVLLTSALLAPGDHPTNPVFSRRPERDGVELDGETTRVIRIGMRDG